MVRVLWVSSGGQTLWNKHKGVWSICRQSTAGDFMLLVDLPEETFTEITVPRLWGSDRTAYVERQLAAKFPECKYRVALPSAKYGSVWDRLAPPHQGFFAIESNEKIDAAIAAQPGPLAGVWSLSVVLVGLATKFRLPSTVLVAAFQEDGVRILFVGQGRPQLTRLVQTAATPEAVGNELVRTVRHLENTKVIERSSDVLPLWILGGNLSMQASLAKDRLQVVRQDEGEWVPLVLGALLHEPMGQLASIQQRAVFLATRVRRKIVMTTVLAALLSVGFIAVQVTGWFEARLRVRQLEMHFAQLGLESAELQERIAAFGVSPQLVRQALELDAREVESAPNFTQHLQWLASAVSQAPGLRVASLDWNYVGSGQGACATSPADPLTHGFNATLGERPRAEIRFKVRAPSEWSLLQQEREWALLSANLKATGGFTIGTDPNTSARDTALSLDASASAQSDVVKEWCLVTLEQDKPR